jgi:hypothetical protein
VGCCLGGCLRLLAFWLWRALLAAAIAILFARVDAYIERRGLGESLAGRAWGAYRARGDKGKKKEPPDTTAL